MVKLNKSEKVFDLFNYFILLLFCVSTLYPFIFLLSLSFTKENYNIANLSLIPKPFSLDSYERVFMNELFYSGFINTFKRTLIGTPLTLIISIFAAYPLSKKYFPNRSFWTGLMVFTMFFNGGLIPNYLLVKNLNLIDSVWSLVLPQLITTFTMIIMRNYFMSLPDSLEESAKLDGANDFLILFFIIIPVSAPIIATVSLWTVVWHWNAWFDSLIYSTTPLKQVVQVILRSIVLEGTTINYSQVEGDFVSPESIKAASIIIVTLPIILAYPFAQKYFIKGIMIGSLKG